MSKLFTPTRIGPYEVSHRIVLAPLTRMRASPGDMPNDLMAKYYEQRVTDGGLLIAEATPVSRQGYGYNKAPGIYDDKQIAGWRKVTHAVHAKGGRIFLQLWHVGRQSHTALQPDNADPVAPSAIRASGHAYSDNGPVEFSTPRALELKEIPAQRHLRRFDREPGALLVGSDRSCCVGLGRGACGRAARAKRNLWRYVR